MTKEIKKQITKLEKARKKFDPTFCHRKCWEQTIDREIEMVKLGKKWNRENMNYE